MWNHSIVRQWRHIFNLYLEETSGSVICIYVPNLRFIRQGSSELELLAQNLVTLKKNEINIKKRRYCEFLGNYFFFKHQKLIFFSKINRMNLPYVQKISPAAHYFKLISTLMAPQAKNLGFFNEYLKNIPPKVQRKFKLCSLLICLSAR